MLLCPVSLNFTFMYSCINQQLTNPVKTKLKLHSTKKQIQKEVPTQTIGLL